MYAWFRGIVLDNAKSVIGAAIIIPLSAAMFWTLWSLLDGRLRTYISTVVVDELGKDKSELSTILGASVEKIRQSEVGAINVGSFNLNSTNRTYTFYVYFPNGYKGTLFYRITGNIAPKQRYVVVLPPNSKPFPLESSENSFALERYFRNSSKQAEVLDDILERNRSLDAFRNNLKAVTFQLEGTEIDKIQANESTIAGVVTVDYVAMIAPVIHLGK